MRWMVVFFAVLLSSGSPRALAVDCGVLLRDLNDEEALAKLSTFPVNTPTFSFSTKTLAAEGKLTATLKGKLNIVNLNGEDLAVHPQDFDVRNFNHIPANTVTGAPASGGPEFLPYHVPAKSPEHLRSLAREILENDAGIVTLHEMIGRGYPRPVAIENLKRNAQDFVDEYLDKKYLIIAVASNDPFGKNSVMLVRNDLPFEMEVQSRVGYELAEEVGPYKVGKKIFSRSHELVLFRIAGRKQPVLAISYNHNKSMYQQMGQTNRPDPDGSLLREIQANFDAAVLRQFEIENPGVPLLSIGDRNANVDTAPAYRALRLFMKNAFDLAGIPADKRATDFYYGEGGALVWSPIDSAMLNEAAQRPGLLVSVHIDQYTDDAGNVLVPPPTKPPPDTPSVTPSDHTPVVLGLDLDNLLGESP